MKNYEKYPVGVDIVHMISRTILRLVMSHLMMAGWLPAETLLIMGRGKPHTEKGNIPSSVIE